MKILWLSHLVPYPPQGGGVLQRSYNLFKAVASEHDVTLLAFNQPALLKLVSSKPDKAIEIAKTDLGAICHSINIVEIPCETISRGKEILALKSLFHYKPYTVNWLESDKYTDMLEKLLSEHDFDLVWFDTISLVQYLKHFNANKTVKILDHHNIESDMLYRRSEQETNLFKKFYFYQEAVKLRLYEKNFLNLFDANVTCSVLDSERLKLISKKAKVCEIPNGVDVEYFTPVAHLQPEPLSMIFVGGMSWYPNRAAMIFFANSVWPKLKAMIPEIKMNVVGKHPPAELHAVSKNNPDFIIHGFLDDVREIMTTSGIYICPISDGGGTKLKILDALAMGKAIVANPIACEGIDVENGKNVLFATTAEEYLSAIQYLVNNPDKIHEMGKFARELIISKYSYDVIGKKLLALLDNPNQTD